MSAKKKNRKRNKKTNTIQFSFGRLIVFLIIAVLTLSCGFIFKSQIESMVNKKDTSITDASVIDENGLSVHFIDVGQGDSIAIRFPDGKTMLVDAGPTASKSNLVEYLTTKFFKTNENTFDYVLLTHSDSDHCGGMPTVCENFVINKIYRPYLYCVKDDIDETNGNASGKNCKDTKIYYDTIKAFKNEIGSNGETAEMIWTDLDTVNSIYKIQGENYHIDFYAPTQKYITTTVGTVANDFSPIMVLCYNNKKIMLTGDASITSEQNAMNRAELPDVDILKVGHHGSKTSSGQEFLNKVKPEIAVISVGKGNSYKHPTTEALNRLTSVGAMIYRTDLNGTIIANVASDTSANINLVVVQSGTQSVYIRVEYIIAGIILLSLTVCFGIKIKA